MVQNLKNVLRLARIKGQDSEQCLYRYLLTYRNTPHSTTGESPAMLLMGRHLRTRLDLMLPSTQKHVSKSQDSVRLRTAHRGDRNFSVGDCVLARNYKRGNKWLVGVIDEMLGDRHVVVKCKDGDLNETLKRHVDQIIKIPDVTERNASRSMQDMSPFVDNVPSVPTSVVTSAKTNVDCDATPTYVSEPVDNKEEKAATDVVLKDVNVSCSDVSTTSSNSASVGETRYPARERKAPSYLKEYVK